LVSFRGSASLLGREVADGSHSDFHCDGAGNSMPARMAMISNDNEEFNQSDMEISNARFDVA